MTTEDSPELIDKRYDIRAQNVLKSLTSVEI
jgi:hypothetical protein